MDGCGFMGRLKALAIARDGLEDYGDLLAVARAEAKRVLKTHENVNVKDTLYSAKCGVHVAVFEASDQIVVDPPKRFGESGFEVEAKIPKVRGESVKSS